MPPSTGQCSLMRPLQYMPLPPPHQPSPTQPCAHDHAPGAAAGGPAVMALCISTDVRHSCSSCSVSLLMARSGGQLSASRSTPSASTAYMAWHKCSTQVSPKRKEIVEGKPTSDWSRTVDRKPTQDTTSALTCADQH